MSKNLSNRISVTFLVDVTLNTSLGSKIISYKVTFRVRVHLCNSWSLMVKEKKLKHHLVEITRKIFPCRKIQRIKKNKKI